MSNLTSFPDLALAREQAAAWVARIDRGLTDAERVELQRWRASPANARALEEFTSLWQELDGLAVLSEVLPAGTTRAHASASTPRRRRWRPLLAAGVAGALVAGASLWMLRGEPRAVDAALAAQVSAHATAVGEQRSVDLPDGSLLRLNTDSLVEVSLGSATREVRLLRGEVHFDVAHEAARPFRVSVAGRTVQAVGTAFDIRLHAQDEVEVIVTDGRVKVLAPGVTHAEALDRGQQLWIAANGTTRLARLDGEALASRLAWRGGMLVFDGQTLAEALDEFSRYTRTRFVVGDPALRELRIGGYFPAGDTDALLDALRSSFGLQATRDADGVIHIGR